MEDARFEIGEAVVDREQDDPNTAIIVNYPSRTADEWNAYRDTSVAEDNPDYPEDAPVAVAVYRDELAEFDPDWAERDAPFSLTEFNEAGVYHYSFPEPRLKSLENEQDGDTADIDADADASRCENEDTDEASASDETADPTDNRLQDLHDHLTSNGVNVQPADDGETLVFTKLGVTYHIHPGGSIEGDGPHRDQVEKIVAEARA